MNNTADDVILLVEDNEDDVFVMQRALKKARIANPLRIVTDGQEAVDYLSAAGNAADRVSFPLPFLVFLDLKLPYLDGFEVLSWIRQQPSLEAVVVVVLTSSAEKKDYERAYALGARSYLVKPPDPKSLLNLMNSLASYWLRNTGSGPVSLGE
jgi:CheY-like chemotaxis protein